MSANTVTATNPVFWHLARPRTGADRSRARQMAFGVAGSGVLLLATLSIIFPPTTPTCDSSGCPVEYFTRRDPLSSLVTESGLRGSTALGALLLIIPFALFALQALRTGTAARERRLASLSLAGATSQDLRRLARMEGTRAAVLGALLAGPAYVMLWLLLGPALPYGSRLLARPGILILLGWLSFVLVMGPLGGLIAQRAAHPASVSPLGLTRRRARPLTQADAVVPAVSLVLAGVGFTIPWGRPTILADLAVITLAILAISGSPWFILLIGRVAASRRNLQTSLAGRRLLADVRTPSRVVAVLLAVGIAFGVIAALVADVLQTPDGYSFNIGFHLTGDGIATAAAVVAALVAISSLVAGAAEQIIDNARATAILVALAASPKFVTRVVRRQMLLIAVPPTVLGAGLGWLFIICFLTAPSSVDSWSGSLAALPAAILAAALTATLGALIATRAVRPSILTSSAPENLRAP